MATPVEMPKLGNTVEECLLARWAKRPGDAVAAGELLAEIETDKAAFELVAPQQGTLLAAFVKEGEVVPVFTNLCVIGEPGEDVEAFRPAVAQAVPPALRPRAEAPIPRAEAPAQPAGISPRARRFAAEHGLDATGFTGSGPGGRLLEQDLRALYLRGPRVSPLARRELQGGFEIRGEGSGVHGLVRARDLRAPSTLREKIARRMREALAASAQYTLNTSADATALLAARRRFKETAGRGPAPDININEMVMFLSLRALRRMPEINLNQPTVSLGFACDTPRGLLVPVVREADRLSLEDLSGRVKELTRQATEGKIGPDDLTGASFTVSNLGALGIESFTPILVPPQIALLGVNSIELRPLRRGAVVEFQDRIGLSLTCDHQFIDGAPGARFLQAVCEEIAQCTI